MKKILLSLSLITSLYSYDTLIKKGEIVSPMQQIKDSKIQLGLNSNDPVEDSLPVFDISCSDIKYTGAYEQIWIDMLEDAKSYIKEVIEPYTTLSKLDAAVYTYAFATCMKDEMSAEISGDETHSSLAQKAKEAVAEGDNALVIKTGISASPQASINVETEVNVKVNAAATTSKTIESSGEEGVFSNVVRCIMQEREKAYIQLYELLSYNLKIKYVFSTAINNSCNLQLKQENETIPTWSEMTGIDLNKYTEKLFNKNNNVSKSNQKKKSRINEFMNEYISEVLSFDISTNSELCTNWNSTTGQCTSRVKIEQKECKKDSKGFYIGGCNCVQGVNVLTGKPCSLPSDDDFNQKYGKNIDYTSASIDSIELSKGEEFFIKILANSSYKTSPIPYDLFFNSDLLIINWNIVIDKSKFLNFKLDSMDNFNIEATELSNAAIDIQDPTFYTLHSETYALKAKNEFSKQLIGYLAFKSCQDNPVCEAKVKEDQYIDDDKFHSVLQKYREYEKKYKSTLDLFNNTYDFYPNIDNYKKKVYNISKALKEIFSANTISRTVAFPNNFKNLLLIRSYQKENEFKLEKRPEKDIWILKNFVKRFYLSFPDNSEEDFKILNQQLYDIGNQTMKERKFNLLFMKANTAIEAQKSSLMEILYH